MRSLLLSFSAFGLLMFSLPTMANMSEKITITGSPMVVQEENGTYVPSTTLETGKDYYYFTIGGTDRVCYQEVNPRLTDLQPSTYNVKIGDSLVSLHCYDYNTEYFVVE